MLSALLQTTGRDPQAPAQFTAGWYYGIAQEDKRDDLMQCYQTDSNLTDTLYDAMEAYIAGDSETADAKIRETKPLYVKALSGCGKLAESIGNWAKRTDDMMSRSDWTTFSKHVYEAHRDTIDRDGDLELREW